MAAGFDSVPASENPFDGMRTRSSFGREMTTCLEATDAMSSRATSMFWAGTVRRSSRPFSSPQMFRSSGRFGVEIVTCVRRAAMSRADVWICSVAMSTTFSESAACGRMYTGIVWSGTAVRSRAASASYGANSAFGSTIVPASIGSDLLVSTPAIVMSLFAVVPSKIVRMVCGWFRTVASIVKSTGFQSAV